ncbi:MAG: aminomethyltransferase family protein [Phycisphaerales bacterium]|nr:aminomethyltransferase family protein [Phycisphaerales bacterium]
MATISPLRDRHERAGAAFLPWGTPENAVEVVETYGEVAIEYAAIRRGCGLIDLPARAVVEITGADRVDFLNRMLTAPLAGVGPMHTRRSFWLNRKGRIDADLRLVELGDRMLVDVDSHAAGRLVSTLTDFVFTEEVEIRDRSSELHRFGLHGPTGPALLEACAELVEGETPSALKPGSGCVLRIAGHRVVVERDDLCGICGLHLTLPVGGVEEVFETLVRTGHTEHGAARAERELAGEEAGGFRLRPIGWAAFNVARIEAGTPLYYIDYGPNSLPHETGVVEDRVSFTKGCYLGQEVVARMHSRGGVKQRLVALRFPSLGAIPPGDPGPQPETGSAILPHDAPPDAKPVGAVTSSTISPMLGGELIALAMVRSAHTAPGTKLLVQAIGETGETMLEAVVQQEMKFLQQ